MTQTRYYFAKIAQAFGLHRRNVRMSDAASEMHLLREAEAHLGEMIWERVEHIDALSVEYWNLRKLLKERDAVLQELKECESRLNVAHEERSTLLNANSMPQDELLEERQNLLEELEQLSIKRDEVVEKAREIRRRYDGLQMKFEVLSREEDPSEGRKKELEEIRTRLVDLKKQFASLKAERLKIAAKIDAGDRQIDELDEKLHETTKGIRSQASQAFQQIGDANRGISTLRSELGLFETRMNHLFAEIGRYISRQASVDPECAAAAKPQMGLINVMSALRRSIVLNHELSGMS